jgi:hypothetical protein
MAFRAARRRPPLERAHAMLNFIRHTEDIPPLTVYLADRSHLLVAGLSGNTFHLTDHAGAEVFVLKTGSPVAADMWAAITNSGRRIWMGPAVGPAVAAPAGTAAHPLVFRDPAVRLQELGCPAAAFVRDATVLAATLEPGLLAQARTATGIDLFGTAIEDGAAAQANKVAKTVTRLRTSRTSLQLKAATASVEHQRQWAHRLQHGWALDTGLLMREREKVWAAKRELEGVYGVDLMSSSSRADRVRIHRWLESYDIRVTDVDGRPTLDRDAFDRVDTAGLDEESREAWTHFRAARSEFSKLAKLNEIERHSRGGRVYGEYLVRGTTTGRAVSRKPGLQSLHRFLRPLLTADVGMVLSALDLANVEIRVAAAMSGDEAMAAAVAAGDVYRTLASSLFDVALSEVTDPQRTAAKHALLQTLYGAAAATVADRVTREGRPTSIPEAAEFVAGIWQAFPALGALRDRLAADTRHGVGPVLASGRPTIPSPKGGHAALNALIASD